MKRALYIGASMMAVAATVLPASAASTYGAAGYKDGSVHVAAAQRRGRPDPTKYSFKIWPRGGIMAATGARVSADTEFGLLTCKTGMSRHIAPRVCWWGRGPQ